MSRFQQKIIHYTTNQEILNLNEKDNQYTLHQNDRDIAII